MVEEKTDSKPFGLAKIGLIRDFFDHKEIFKDKVIVDNTIHVKDLERQITYENEMYPYIKLKLKDIMQFNEELYYYIKNNPDEAINDICDTLLSRVKELRNVRKFLDDKIKCRFQKIHLSFDLSEIEDLIPLYNNFSLGTKSFDFKLIRIVARFLDLQLFREKIAEIIKYECCVCGTAFDIVQFKGTKGKYRKPNFCVNGRCKAKGYNDFRVKDIEEYHEMGNFRIGDLDYQKQIDMNCFTFFDFDYFSEKAQQINLNDTIEIIGIIENDYSEIGTRKDNQMINEYVKVIDFNPIEIKETDEKSIKWLYNKFSENRDFFFEIFDSIHPTTRGIYTFQIFKIIEFLSNISSNSWDSFLKYRCQINYIAGSVPSMMKGSITGEFRRILGVNNIGRLSGQYNTPQAFLPTSQRGKDKDFQIRYGALAYHNTKHLLVDEFQYMLRSDILTRCLKGLEDGFLDKGTDGTVLHAECKLSLGCLMNYFSEDGSEGYDYSISLRNNLCNIEQSTLERIDLHYVMHKLPELFMDLIEMRIFEEFESELDENLIYNYFKECKRIYPLQKISPKMNKLLREYIKLLRNKRNTKTSNIREFRTLVKLVCGVSAMRMKTEIDESDLQFVQKHLVNLMIPFFEYDTIREEKLNQLNMTEVFRDTFKLISEVLDDITIATHISIIREFLTNHYFPYDNSRNKRIDKVMKNDLTTANNSYRTLYENEENRDFIEKLNFLIVKKGKNVHYVKKDLLKENIIEAIGEMIDNEDDSIEIDWLINEFEMDYSLSKDTFKTLITELLESNQLTQLKNGNIKPN